MAMPVEAQRAAMRAGSAALLASPGDGEALAARLRDIAAAKDLSADGLERALKAILEATGAAAGAICLYDQRRECLRLAAESGLSDEGCRRLRTVRRGDAANWDMPLHGLLNRRAYVIESAAQNRYVPPLVESKTSVRAVACLPLYGGPTPVGSLILIMLGSNRLHDRDVHTLDKALRELARMIETIRRQVTETGSTTPSRPLAAAPVITRPALAETNDAAEPAALARARTENTRLEAELERLRAEEQSRDQCLAGLMAEADRLRARLGETEAAQAALAVENARLIAEVDRARQESPDVETLAAELARARDEHARLAAALEAVAAERMDESQSRTAREAALAAEHTGEVERLQARLAEAEAKVEREQHTREALESARAALESVQAELASTHDELEDLRGREGALRGERDSLGVMLEEERERERELSGRLESCERELEGLRVEHAREVPAAPEPPAEMPAQGDVPAPLAAAPVASPSGSSEDGAERPLVVVLDGDRRWERAASKAQRLAVIPPEDGAVVRLAELAPPRLLVNLTSPRALETLVALRASGCTAPVWGCVADAAGNRGLALGMIEPATRPLDPDVIFGALQTLAKRGSRVVTVAEDVEAFVSLRQRLAREGMSVSMAWNAKQAADLLPMIRPAVVVLDLDLPAAEACAVVAQIAASEPVPAAVLVAGRRDPTAVLAGVLADPASAPLVGPLKALLGRVLENGGRRPATGDR
jgi:CheY-like chemotaxis protein